MRVGQMHVSLFGTVECPLCVTPYRGPQCAPPPLRARSRRSRLRRGQIYNKAFPLDSVAGLRRARGLGVGIGAGEGTGGGGRGDGTGGGSSSDGTGAHPLTLPKSGGNGGGSSTDLATWPWAGCEEPPRTARRVKAVWLRGKRPYVISPLPETDLPKAKQLRLCLSSKSWLRYEDKSQRGRHPFRAFLTFVLVPQFPF